MTSLFSSLPRTIQTTPVSSQAYETSHLLLPGRFRPRSLAVRLRNCDIHLQ